MGVAEVKVTLGNVSNIPADRVVNVFHVASVPATPMDLLTRFQAFYNAVNPTSGDALAQWLSPELSRAALACTLDVYDLDDPIPRVPVATSSWTLGATTGTIGMPAEVALCVSWNAAPESGVPAGRLRGRNFIGPWQSGALSLSEPSRPIANAQECLREAGQLLLDDVALVVYSRAGATPVARPVVGGYVDNSWDTMRSRGVETTSRLLITSP